MDAEMDPILARGDVMAGKFLSIDEVSQRLGTTTDEVLVIRMLPVVAADVHLASHGRTVRLHGRIARPHASHARIARHEAVL
jgi:hypothetical protein